MIVSVVVSNYNYARFLPACLDSVLAQTYKKLEIIVVDDGSTDDSRVVLESYAPRVRAIFQPNGGQASAINRGVAESNGDVLCFLDSDDGWAPEKVERVLAVLNQHPEIGWVRHKARMVDESQRPLSSVAPMFSGSKSIPADPALFLERVVTVQPGCLAITRQVADKVFPIIVTPALAFDADDAVMLARIFATGQPGYSIDEVLGFYRRHAGERFGAHDIPKLLRREADVAEALAGIFGDRPAPSATFKLRAIVGAMEGASWWDTRRRQPFLRGLSAVMRLWRRPQLMVRQGTSLTMAFMVPDFWLRRLAKSQSWPPVN